MSFEHTSLSAIRNPIGTFRHADRKNQEPKEDFSEVDPHPELGTSFNRSTRSINSDADAAKTIGSPVFVNRDGTVYS